MRIKMTKPVPGYPYPGKVSTTHERAFALIMNDCAAPVDAPQAFLDKIDSEKARIECDGPTSEWLSFEQTPEAAPGIYEKGVDSKSQKRKKKQLRKKSQ